MMDTQKKILQRFKDNLLIHRKFSRVLINSMSVRSRGNKCYTRRNKNGGAYVVCNDPPKGSKGQAGVYQAANPTGKQDGRSKKQEEITDKIRSRNRVRKSMMTKDFQKEFGEKSTVNQRTPKNAPATSTMRRDLESKGTNPIDLIGMGRLYVYTRWANETDEGKKFIKDKNLEKPTKFAGVDDRDAIREAAQDILSNQGRKNRGLVKFNEKGIDDFPIRAEYDEWEEGELSAREREHLEERSLRYKHYLELAGRKVPDWVKDIAR